MKRKPTSFEAFLPLLLMMIFVIVGGVILELQFEIVLLAAAVSSALLAKRVGVTFDEMMTAYTNKIAKAFPALLILVAIGAIVGTWMFSGTVPMLIFYGLKWLNPKFVVVTAFIVTALVSMFTGTSWGSAATSGVAFIGIAQSLGVPLPIVAGAVISGAFFGDKLSPVSDTTNLSAMASDVNVYAHVKSMVPNAIFATIIAVIGFIMIGVMNTSGSGTLTPEVLKVIADLDSMYNFSILMLIPALIVFGGAFFGISPLILMFGASAVAAVIGVVLNGFTIADATVAFTSGFNINMIKSIGLNPETISPSLLSLLNRGGMAGMMSGAVLFAFIAMAFGSFMEVAGCLEVIVNSLKKFIKGSKSLVYVTFAVSAILISVTSNGQFVILTVGQIFKDSFEEKGLPLTLLSRTMENSITLFEGLLPFTVTGIYMAATLGVPTLAYAPWAFFNIAAMGLFLAYFVPKDVRNADLQGVTA